MRYKAIALAAAVMLAFGASGAVATSMTNGPTAETLLSSDDAQPADYTGDVVDPDDKLSSQDAEDAREIAWANDDVRDRLDDIESPYLEVLAPSDGEEHVSVRIAENETAPTQVVVDVDLESGTVESIDEVETITADKSQNIDFDSEDVEVVPNGAEIDFEDGDDEPVIEIPSEEMEVENLNGSEYTVVEEGEIEF